MEISQPLNIFLDESKSEKVSASKKIEACYDRNHQKNEEWTGLIQVSPPGNKDAYKI